MNSNISWTIIDKFFKDNPKILVRHHLDSYNDFFKSGLKRIFKEKNPIVLQKEQNKETMEFKLRTELYLGGKDGDKIYYGKPVIYDDNREHYMYPNEARLRNMTYGMSIHYDVEVNFKIRELEEETEHSIILEKIFLGRFPIMLQSDLCILNGLSTQVRYNMGECKNDHGGYFIIDGKEKTIVSQEKFADNMLYIRDKVNDIYSHSADIRSVSEDASKPERTMSIRIVAPTPSLSNNQIVVNIPNVRKPIPLFILMRALGIISDEKIIEYCLLDLDANSSLVDLFIPSIHDAGKIFTQETALKYISTFTKWKSIAHTQEILSNYFLPHIGELNFQQKAYFVGYMVYNLLQVFTKIEKPTDRDNFRFKRIDLPGTLLYNLFKEYYNLQQNHIRISIDKEYYYKKSIYEKNFISLIENNFQEYFRERLVEAGFKKAFKGNWGATEHTKKLGIVQDLNRLSYNSFISHLRKIILPLEASAKIIKPRLLHGSQWGIIDPVDTPDGQNVGLHKHMAMSAHITSGCSGYPMINFLRRIGNMKLLEECSSKYLFQTTKVFINGAWVGVVDNPVEIERVIKLYRRNGLIPIYTSSHWHIEENAIFIYTDSGRLCRPILYMDEDTKKVSYDKKIILEKLEGGNFTWEQLITGFAEKKDKNYTSNSCTVYDIDELYAVKDFDALKESKAIIEYIDSAEEESALIAMNVEKTDKSYTHVEIHPSLILGVMGNQVVFPENNQLPRDVFSCGQSKQAASLYHSNFYTRIDKMGIVLNSGQIPLVKSRYLEYINHEQHPCGENPIVAIMSYGGYNVEDSILFNEGAINRGLFGTTYYNMYEAREDSSKVAGSTIDSHFANIESENVIGLKPGYDYSSLDKWGLITENTQLDDKKVLIGKTLTNLSDPNTSLDASTFPKKGQLGFVDKTFITEGEEGFRLAKIRIRENRIPAVGDKFSSRCGQKGTIGLVIPEEDMPFTADGLKPDLIVNPHALPSRMTIGQLVETLMGKACALYGGFGDCTAFVNKGPKNKIFGDMLTHVGYNSTGNQLLYNGMTGEQLVADIFIGPTYYMRLKHMVKDKINYRAQGPRTMLTRQTVQGRANDGGLRIGEMERDGLIAHGAAGFIAESMMKRGDEYFMAVCNKTGTIAVYNSSLNIFLSPMSDGPIKFSGTLDNNMNIVNVSRYGRTFSVVRVPYAFKLLMQELQVLNIQIRVITEENIDQLTSMAYSNNIDKLLFEKGVPITNIIADNKKVADEYDEKKITPRAKFETPIREETPTPTPTPPPPTPQPIPVDPKNLGWDYLGFTDVQGNYDLYESIIVDINGDVTEKWKTEEHGNKKPDKFPAGWKADDLYYNDRTEIPSYVMTATLRENRVANNWVKSLEIIRSTDKGKRIPETPQTYEGSPSYTQVTPTSPSYTTPYDPTDKSHPMYSPSYDPTIPQSQGGPPPAISPEQPPSGEGPIVSTPPAKEESTTTTEETPILNTASAKEEASDIISSVENINDNQPQEKVITIATEPMEKTDESVKDITEMIDSADKVDKVELLTDIKEDKKEDEEGEGEGKKNIKLN